jgi:hypothetical protein
MGRSIRSTSIDWGRNPDTFVPSDRENVRCSKCGFICNKTRENQSDEGSRIGYPITYTQYYTERTIVNGVVTSVVSTT